jgi:cell division protein FtsB
MSFADGIFYFKEEKMPEGNEAEGNVEEPQTQAPEPEVTLESVQAELVETKKAMEKLTNENKAHKSTISNLQKKKDPTLTQVQSDLSNLNAKFEAFLEWSEESRGADEDKPVKSIKERVNEKPKVNPQVGEFQNYAKEVAGEIFKLCSSKGLDFNKSKEVREQYFLFRNGLNVMDKEEIDQALEEVKEVISNMESKGDTTTDTIKKLEEEVARLKAEKEGGLESVTGLPGGGTLSDAEFIKAYGDPDGKPTSDDHERAKKILGIK